MSAPSSGALLRRVAAEHRRVLLPLGVALVVNVLVYAFAVYPLSQRVANIEQSSRAAQNELRTAKGEYDRANGTLTGKDKAARELTTFYTEVLPNGFTAARRLTTLKLTQLAENADLDWSRLSVSPTEARESTLKQHKIQMDLAGSYANIRAFIHELEVSPDFVVIDNLSLNEGADDGGTLVVNLQLSTYYRDAK